MPVTQIEAQNAFEKLKEPNAILIDVRSEAEFAFVGIPDLKNLILLPWRTFPGMALNQNFVTILEEKLQQNFGENRFESELFFICRSGARSQEAAVVMTEFGYKKCFNIVSGFEGDLDNLGHRGNINGWKAQNLNWRQS